MSPHLRLKRALLAAATSSKPGVPEAGLLLWHAFVRLSNARSYSQLGPNPISHAEIEAYARLMRLPLTPHHVETLRAMDEAWLAQVQSGQGATPQGKAQPLTAGMFDAVFG